ncbi:hypothetical protein B0H11DRAFT_358597 [Mycena galericulata]|nr:hypothetical protein B0H11DRAFT_358597 [Mycena galericulata]
MKEFPQELVDSVLDDYADLQLGHRDWAQYSLVCRAWLPATRRQLFSHVNTQFRNSREYKGRTTTAFLSMLLNESCTFIPFVTHLSLNGIDIKAEDFPTVFQTLSIMPAVSSMHFDKWSFELGIQPIQDYLSGLGNLAELSLSGTIKSSLQLFSLLECCSSLSSLNIALSKAIDWGFSDVTSKHIAFWAGKIPAPPPPPPAPIIHYSRANSIEQLSLDCEKAKGLDVLEVFNATTGSNLTCRTVRLKKIAADQTQSIGLFLQSLGNRLEHLEIGFESNQRDQGKFCDDVDLRHNTGLRTLHVTDILADDPVRALERDMHLRAPGRINRTPDLTNQHLTRLPAILRRCASPHLTAFTFSSYSAALDSLADFDWAALDDSLILLLQQLPSSANAEIKFCVTDYGHAGDRSDQKLAWLAEDIQARMPRSWGQFRFTFLPGGLLPLSLFG